MRNRRAREAWSLLRGGGGPVGSRKGRSARPAAGGSAGCSLVLSCFRKLEKSALTPCPTLQSFLPAIFSLSLSLSFSLSLSLFHWFLIYQCYVFTSSTSFLSSFCFTSLLQLYSRQHTYPILYRGCRSLLHLIIIIRGRRRNTKNFTFSIIPYISIDNCWSTTAWCRRRNGIHLKSKNKIVFDVWCDVGHSTCRPKRAHRERQNRRGMYFRTNNLSWVITLYFYDIKSCLKWSDYLGMLICIYELVFIGCYNAY